MPRRLLIGLVLLLVACAQPGTNQYQGYCGDHRVQTREVCDSTDLRGDTCEKHGFYGGQLTCNSTCDGVDTSGCFQHCGDNMIEADLAELCDTDAFGSDSCQARGFYRGLLVCFSDCQSIDASGCTGRCGDGVLDHGLGEVCDGTELGGATCAQRGYYRGSPLCAPNCKSLSYDGCSGRCGDHVVDADAGEECDTTVPVGADCPVGETGAVLCGRNCRLDLSGCHTVVDAGPADAGPPDAGTDAGHDAGTIPPTCPVARAETLGSGRVFVWGDEHVLFDSYWPSQQPFWANAMAWLGQRSGSPNITSIGFAVGGAAPALITDLRGRGYTVNTAATAPAVGDPPSIVVLELGGGALGAPEGAAVRTWVEGGGAVMVLVSGIGIDAECLAANPFLEQLGLAISCANPPPWGPVTSFEPHPIASGLTPANAPFVNGRYVVETVDGGSAVVASVYTNGQCPLP
jgi:hypothetical protein